MHEYEYQIPPQALWEWDDGQSMYPPNTDEPMIIYRGADSDYTMTPGDTEAGEGTLRLTIRDRSGRMVWQTEPESLEATVTVPAQVTKDMQEGRHRYFFDIMLVTEDERRTLQGVTPVWVYPTAGGAQYD
jgi:hypothetical protein